mmetsp:Transcript_76708/g.225192  ORF Transcript_76708/g.225192 Transcript_76708/m.225192 type:complete len:288 (+) Transcript_76708:385-1248(+)
MAVKLLPASRHLPTKSPSSRLQPSSQPLPSNTASVPPPEPNCRATMSSYLCDLHALHAASPAEQWPMPGCRRKRGSTSHEPLLASLRRPLTAMLLPSQPARTPWRCALLDSQAPAMTRQEAGMGTGCSGVLGPELEQSSAKGIMLQEAPRRARASQPSSPQSTADTPPSTGTKLARVAFGSTAVLKVMKRPRTSMSEPAVQWSVSTSNTPAGFGHGALRPCMWSWLCPCSWVTRKSPRKTSERTWAAPAISHQTARRRVKLLTILAGVWSNQSSPGAGTNPLSSEKT